MEHALQQRDADLKEKYGLGQRIQLDRQDPASVEKEKESWRRIKDRHLGQPRSIAPVPDLAKVVKQNTLKRYDPFDSTNREVPDSIKAATRGGVRGGFALGVKAKGKGKVTASTDEYTPATASRKRRRLLEDEAEVDNQLDSELGNDFTRPSASPDDPPSSLAQPAKRRSPGTQWRPGETTAKPTSGLVGYGSDSGDSS